MMIRRTAETQIRRLAGQFPVIIISGPRQSGKTTLIRSMYPEATYVNLERPDTLDRIQQDPRAFLTSIADQQVIIDEAQRFAELSSWIQTEVDENRQPGRFFLTGSNQPLPHSQVGQSLAGRAASVFLLPFSLEELGDRALTTTEDLLFTGFYPPLYDQPFKPVDWFANYTQLYLERDVLLLTQLKDLRTFHRFLRLCAGRNGQILNISAIARDADISHTTARQWLSILESSYILFLLPCWHKNYNKRLVKSPKLYFHDVGLAGYLIGITQPDQWQVHPLRGAFFESMVVSEMVKRGASSEVPSTWYYWNNPGGVEIDLIKSSGTHIDACEIKSNATFRPEQTKNLIAWGKLTGIPESRLHLLYNGTEAFRFKGIDVRPWGMGF